MTEFMPDYSSPQALRDSYLARAREARKAAESVENNAAREALIADAESAEMIADKIGGAGA